MNPIKLVILLLSCNSIGIINAQNNFLLADSIHLNQKYIKQIDSFLIVNGKASENIDIICTKVSGLFWSDSLFTLIKGTNFNLERHPKPEWIGSDATLLILNINSQNSLGAMLIRGEVYFWTK